MPTSEFETALTERIEFAVFVAYEQWVRASNYESHNPYDLLARMLPGLVEEIAAAAARRGGWGAFDPTAGGPGGALIHEVAAQAVAARLGSLAPEAPEPTLLAQVVTEAVGRAVSGFVDDPDSWRLSLNPGEPRQTSLADRSTRDPAGIDVLPVLPEEDGGEAAAPIATAAPQTASTAAPAAMDEAVEQWYVRLGSGGLVTAIAVDSASNIHIYVDLLPSGTASGGGGGGGDSGGNATPDIDGADPGGDSRPGDQGGGTPPFLIDNPSVRSVLDYFATMPPDVARLVLELMEKGDGNEVTLNLLDGSQVVLSGNAARDFRETADSVLTQSAMSEPPADARQMPVLINPRRNLEDLPPVAGPGSDTLLLPTTDILAVSSEESVLVVAVASRTPRRSRQT
jgi:hypothetical protein